MKGLGRGGGAGKARATCWPENGPVELADTGTVSLCATDNEGNHQGLSKEY